MPATIRSDLAKRGVLDFPSFLTTLGHSGIALRDALDVGAYRGETVAQILKHVSGKVYAYEPIADAPAELMESDRVLWRKVGLSDFDGRVNFATPSDKYSNSISPRGYVRKGLTPLLKQFYGRLVHKESTSVSHIHLVRADQDLPARASIDLVKLDIQGGELRALRGLEQHASQIDFMWVEYTGSQPGLLRYLKSHGFQLFESAYLFERPRLGRISSRYFKPLMGSEEETLSSGLYATRQSGWRHFAAEFQYLKRFEGLIQTDLACIRPERLSSLDIPRVPN